MVSFVSKIIRDVSDELESSSEFFLSLVSLESIIIWEESLGLVS